MDIDQENKKHLKEGSGRKARENEKKTVNPADVRIHTDSKGTTLIKRKRKINDVNKKAFAIQSVNKARKKVAYVVNKQTARHTYKRLDSAYLEAPLFVTIVGAKGSGKSTLMRTIMRHFLKRRCNIEGPVTVGKKTRVTFYECPDDINSLITISKVTDYVLLLINVQKGITVENLELIEMLNVHGAALVRVVFTHIDGFRVHDKMLKKKIKEFSNRIQSVIYATTSKLGFLDKHRNEKSAEYKIADVSNLVRAVMNKKPRPVVWRQTHPYVIGDRLDKVTNVDEEAEFIGMRFYGYVRGCAVKPEFLKFHLDGVGDLVAKSISVLPDPCPTVDSNNETGLKLSALKEAKAYAPLSGYGGIVRDFDGFHVLDSKVKEDNDDNEDDPYEQFAPTLFEDDDDEKDDDEGENETDEEDSSEPDEKKQRLSNKNGDVLVKFDDLRSLVGENTKYFNYDSIYNGIELEEDEKERPDISNLFVTGDRGKEDASYLLKRDEELGRNNGKGSDDSEEEDDESDNNDEEEEEINESEESNNEDECDEEENDINESGESSNEDACDEEEEEIKESGESSNEDECDEEEEEINESGESSNEDECDEEEEEINESGESSNEDECDEEEEEINESGESSNEDECDDKNKENDDDNDDDDEEEGWTDRMSGMSEFKRKKLERATKTKREKKLEKKLKHKQLFDKLYDQQHGGSNANEFFETWKESKEEQERINKETLSKFQNKDDLVNVAGIYPGSYVCIEFDKVPAAFHRNFKPSRLLVLGGINPGEDVYTFHTATVHVHKLYDAKKDIKNFDPVCFSIGWRKIQSFVHFYKVSDDLKNLNLKYSLKSPLYFNVCFWAPLVPNKTGLIGFNDFEHGENSQFRIRLLGSVKSTEKDMTIEKKMKAIGNIVELKGKTAFIKMFGSNDQSRQKLGSMLKTTSGIRGAIKTVSTKHAEGTVRATFEAPLTFSDIPFLTMWCKLDLYKDFQIVNLYCMDPDEKFKYWVPWNEWKRAKGISNNQSSDNSKYVPIERVEPEFKQFKMSKKLISQLPYKARPAIPEPEDLLQKNRPKLSLSKKEADKKKVFEMIQENYKEKIQRRDAQKQEYKEKVKKRETFIAKKKEQKQKEKSKKIHKKRSIMKGEAKRKKKVDTE